MPQKCSILYVKENGKEPLLMLAPARIELGNDYDELQGTLQSRYAMAIDAVGCLQAFLQFGLCSMRCCFTLH